MTPTEYLFAALNQIRLALGPALVALAVWVIWKYVIPDMRLAWRMNAPEVEE